MKVALIVLLTLLVVFPVYGEEDLRSFTLVLTWPNGFCRVNPNCYRPVPQDFTLHGFWPVWRNGSNAEFCPSNTRLRLENQGDITSLSQHWPSLCGLEELGHKNQREANFDFWKYQWNKHGTCSNLDPLVYFHTALRLKNEINLLNALRLSMSAIKKQTGYRPVVKCTKLSGRGLVLEIHLCVDLPTPQFPIYRLVSCTNQRSIDCHGDGTNIYLSAQNRYQALVTWT
ncbi:hypothetical protein Acr_27g0009380 [Actinidia rufa]|uniref:Uncharacterized protein n=1 Tax=Actinidia rufa TaxID=165716 RepID=A0A7J0H810_9ERIC|nr:hypothetical protein Acr_27g0009380 [Actinidia rufa]